MDPLAAQLSLVLGILIIAGPLKRGDANNFRDEKQSCKVAPPESRHSYVFLIF